MAEVNISLVLRSLENDLRRAMTRAVQEGRQGVKVGPDELLRAFIDAAQIECGGFRTVPDAYVKAGR